MQLSTSLSIVAVAALLATSARAQANAFATRSRSYHTGSQLVTEGYRPEEFVLADLDGDGDLDAAIANNGNFISPQVSVLLNRGDGVLSKPRFFPASGEMMDVVAGDLDGDGDLDLAFALSDYGSSGSGVAVFLNNGDATFGPEKTWATPAGPTGIALLDADGDGDLDLATANWHWSSESISVLVNDGAAGFATRADYAVTGEQPYRIAAGDLDGDGFPELAASVRGGSPALFVFGNDGLGGFGAPKILTVALGSNTEVPGVTIADVDADGDLDLLFGGGSNGPSVFFNDGAGKFGGPASLVSGYGFGSVNDLDVGDVNGDGDPDVVSVQHSSKYGFQVIGTTGTGGWQAARAYRSGEMARAVSLGDMDADGDLDVVVANAGSNTLTVHRNDAGVLDMPPLVPTSAFANGEVRGDLDGDGDLDLLVVGSTQWLLTNDGAGGFTATSLALGPGAISAPALGDADGDGDLDLFFRRNGLELSLNTPTGFALPSQIPTTGCVWGEVVVLDANADGLLDVATNSCGSGNHAMVLLGLGGGAFGPPVVLSSFSLPGGNEIDAADFDEDGRVDLMTGHGTGVAFWKGNGDGTFGAPYFTDLTPGSSSNLVIDDFDADGHLDVAATSQGSTFQGELMTVSLGYGDGGFRPAVPYFGMFSLQYGGATCFASLDVDADGDRDLVAGCYGANDVALFENAGDGTFVPEARYGVDGVVNGILTGDWDGDGLEDVAAVIGTEAPIGGGVTILFAQPFSSASTTYCTAKTNSLGCVPSIGSSGAPNPSSTSGFVVRCRNVRNNKPGVLIYSLSGRSALPFQGGLLCVKTPLRRTPGTFSGGKVPPANDCSGVYQLDLLAFAHGALGGNPAPELLLVGQRVDVQWWGRDQGFPSPMNTTLSDGLEFTVGF